jgi:hypothetical protein
MPFYVALYSGYVMHHALCNVIEPLCERIFIYDSNASRKGKGTHAARCCFVEFTATAEQVLMSYISLGFITEKHFVCFVTYPVGRSYLLYDKLYYSSPWKGAVYA